MTNSKWGIQARALIAQSQLESENKAQLLADEYDMGIAELVSINLSNPGQKALLAQTDFALRKVLK